MCTMKTDWTITGNITCQNPHTEEHGGDQMSHLLTWNTPILHLSLSHGYMCECARVCMYSSKLVSSVCPKEISSHGWATLGMLGRRGRLMLGWRQDPWKGTGLSWVWFPNNYTENHVRDWLEVRLVTGKPISRFLRTVYWMCPPLPLHIPVLKL